MIVKKLKEGFLPGRARVDAPLESLAVLEVKVQVIPGEVGVEVGALGQGKAVSTHAV